MQDSNGVKPRLASPWEHADMEVMLYPRYIYQLDILTLCYLAVTFVITT
jgi:hypothetical protein